MQALHAFLDEHLNKHNERIKILRNLSHSVVKTLLLSRKLRKGRWDWPYSCLADSYVLKEPAHSNKKKGKPQKAPEKTPISISTQAMICASIDRILVHNATHKILDKQERSDLEKAQLDVEKRVLTSLQRKAAQGPLLNSSTYGPDDVFTASWLLQMYSGKQNWRTKDVWWTPTIKKRLVRIISNAIFKTIEGKAVIIDYERGLFKKGENEAGPHSLPLLKIISALEIIEDDKSDGKRTLKEWWPVGNADRSVKSAIELAGDWLEKNLHRQMSFYQFKDFRFDAAELIFCLYGSIKTGRITEHESIIDNVLQVVREAQQRSIYWRPYRPMTSSSQGGVLLPLSIEVAVALLATLKQTKKFVKYADTLEGFFDWLYSQRLIPPDTPEEKSAEWVGWHSENTYESKVIHIWDTALVGAFLVELLNAKDEHFQEQLLKVGSFTVERPHENRKLPTLENMISPDRILGANGITERLKNEFSWKKGSYPKKFSLLIYGPPGTSKTTLARIVAKSLEWPLVYLSPSNFITSGEAGIEQQTKDIFDVLNSLRNKVVFFDEIDRLILDRDSGAYDAQDDMFQFMTPSMLTKISSLREGERVIFIIATNYEDHIDMAIKREGRIDEAIPWLPMDLEARTEQFKRFIDDAFRKEFKPVWTEAGLPEEVPKWPQQLTKSLKKFAMRCPLLTYPQLERCFKQASAGIVLKTLHHFRSQCVMRFSKLRQIPASEVSLDMYKRRIKGVQDKRFVQRPFLEYAYLLALLGESEDSNAEAKFIDLINTWQDTAGEDYRKRRKDVKKRMTAYGLKWKMTS